MTVKLAVDNKIATCLSCKKNIYQQDLFTDPFRPLGYWHKDCFKNILKYFPLSIASRLDLV